MDAAPSKNVPDRFFPPTTNITISISDKHNDREIHEIFMNNTHTYAIMITTLCFCVYDKKIARDVPQLRSDPFLEIPNH